MFKKKELPHFPGILAMLGPGIVWMALAQGSGELIWWPYIIAKYGLGFLFLLIPACLLQYPLNYEIGRYTLLTGESIWQGFIRLNKIFAFCLWILMITSFLWFGAFASAGGTSLASLTNFPAGFSTKAQSLFWAYLSIGVFLIVLLFSPVVYKLIEKFMFAVAIITLIGLIAASIHPDVFCKLPDFINGLFIPHLPVNFDNKDATKLLTAITFAGLGGFWTLFYSYWLREKGVGMAKYFGHITSPITGKKEMMPDAGFIMENTANSKKQLPQWLNFLKIDSGIGIFGNLFTTFLTCLLSYALLFPKGIIPQDWEIAVVQSRFFEVSWGTFGKILFLIIAAAFLSDTWIGTIDSVARVNTDIIYNLFQRSKKYSIQFWYYFFIVVLTIITSITMLFTQPGTLILISAVIGFIGTVIFTIAILILNHFYLPKFLPEFAKPKKFSFLGISISSIAYLVLAIAYLYVIF